MDEKYEAQAQLVAESCRMLGTLDLTKEALGHVSLRLDDDTILIKGKGLGETGLRFTNPRDVIRADFDANKIGGADDLQPPGETYIHIWLYKYRPEVNCVIHMHPEDAVLISICGKPLIPLMVPSSKFVIQGVADFPRALMIHNHEIGEEFAKTMGDKSTCLMRGHGITVVGTTVEEATVNAIQFSEYMTMLYKAYLLGDPQPLSGDDLRFAEESLTQTNRKRGTPGGMESIRASWRYYQALAYEKSGNRASWFSTEQRS